MWPHEGSLAQHILFLLAVPTVGFLTVCFQAMAPSLNKDGYVCLLCGFGLIKG